MDLKHTTTTTVAATTTTTTADSPDTDGETPLHSQQITPFSPYPTNIKHHHAPPPTVVISYKECLKNHAATIGSHALDGCGEFMPSPSHTPSQPTSLTCAACGCHRNFHRREPTTTTNFLDFHHASAPHVMLSLTSGDHHNVATPGTPAAIKMENYPNGRKRFRTKFSQEQKEKMYLFAEKIGWKMQRCDDKMVMDFCNGIGIRRGIFKVWMHNNKNTFGNKKDNKDFVTMSPTTGNGGGMDLMDTMGDGVKRVGGVYNNGDHGHVVSSDHSHEDANVNGGHNSTTSSDHQENGGGGGGDGCLLVSNNGSSSSC